MQRPFSAGPTTTAESDRPEPHAGLQADAKDGYWLMQPVYDTPYLESVHPTHKPPTKTFEKIGYYTVQTCRGGFDIATRYGHNMTPEKWLTRILFLETIAGVPGFVAGMLRHMRSLRTMQRDHGWIHTLLEEAENERMHLLTFLELKKPGPFMRTLVLLGQGVFFNAYLLAYILSPKTCHAFVGYLEEEAVKTYTHCVNSLDAGEIEEWSKMQAPEIAKSYWRLKDDATMRDVILNVRADEACHSYVNHTFSDLKADETNPFEPGTHMVSE